MPVVHIMSTPAQAVAGTFAYLRICFAGLPFIIAYNVVADIFRGMGDSRTPLYFVIIACICNIALDFIFIGMFGLGPSGAALATVIAQAVSVISALVMILRMHLIDGLTRRHLIPVGKVCRTMLGIGIPVTAQNAFIQFSFILITVLANRRGINRTCKNPHRMLCSDLFSGDPSALGPGGTDRLVDFLCDLFRGAASVAQA